MGAQLLIYPQPSLYSGKAVLFNQACSFWRDTHGTVREEGDTRLVSQISRINPGDQWGDRCHRQIALTSTFVFLIAWISKCKCINLSKKHKIFYKKVPVHTVMSFFPIEFNRFKFKFNNSKWFQGKEVGLIIRRWAGAQLLIVQWEGYFPCNVADLGRIPRSNSWIQSIQYSGVTLGHWCVAPKWKQQTTTIITGVRVWLNSSSTTDVTFFSLQGM